MRKRYMAIIRESQPTDAGEPGHVMGWDKLHRRAWLTHPVARMIEGAARYADVTEEEAYGREDTRSTPDETLPGDDWRFVGEDYILGDAWRDILKGVLVLLNGDLRTARGELQPGVCDHMIRAMFVRAGFDDQGDNRA